MKIVTYNIWNGCLSNWSRVQSLVAPVRFHRGRRRLLREFLEREQADVVVLEEAAGWSHHTCATFARLTGYPYWFRGNAPTGYHILILSRRPYQWARDLNPSHGQPLTLHWWKTRRLWHTAVCMEFDTFSVIGIHLCPKGPSHQDRELPWLTEISERYQPALIVGDANCLRSHDYSPELRAQLTSSQQRKFGPSHHISPIDSLVVQGFTDLFEELPDAFTVPTAANTDPAHAGPPLRLDYMLASPKLIPFVSDPRVIRNPLTECISDHYPLTVTIDAH